MNSHPHPKLRPQSDLRIEADLLAGIERQFPFSRDRRDEQNAFGPREALADASTDAAAEREVDVSIAGFFYADSVPAFGAEF